MLLVSGVSDHYLTLEHVIAVLDTGFTPFGMVTRGPAVGYGVGPGNLSRATFFLTLFPSVGDFPSLGMLLDKEWHRKAVFNFRYL